MSICRHLILKAGYYFDNATIAFWDIAVVDLRRGRVQTDMFGRLWKRMSRVGAEGSFPIPGAFRGAMMSGLAAMLMLSGCGKAPKGQVVAIVNGTEISIQQLSAELADIPIPDTLDRKKLSKVVLEGVIDRELQVEEARKQKLDKDPLYLALLKRNEEELLASMLGHNVAQTVPLPVEREIQNYIDSHPLQFAKRQRLQMDQLSFTPPKDRSKLAMLANVHTLDAADAALRSIGIVPVRGTGVIDTALTEPDIARQIDAAPAGEPIMLPQNDLLVIGVITGREVIKAPSEVANLAAARAVRAATLLRESQAQIAAARDKAKISYEDPDLAPDPKDAKKK
jgi:peptidyl-prolyl cis-trans isomerase C